MRRCALALVSALMLCVPGCYESKVPLASSEKSTIEPALLGDWMQVVEPAKNTGDEAESPSLLRIMKFNDHEYCACWQEVNDHKAILYRAYSVAVGDTKIVNVQFIGKEDHNIVFVFFKYTVTDKGRLVLQMMNGESPLLKDKEFKTSGEFMTFVKEHLADETLFRDSIEFQKTEGLELHMTQEKD